MENKSRSIAASLAKEMRETATAAGIANNLQLPSGIQFNSGDVIGTEAECHIHLPVERVTANMQEDGSAFEGWMLVLRRWTTCDSFAISWDAPPTPSDGHYQRFLYRVEWMLQLFPDWFHLVPGMDNLLNQSRLKKDGKFLLNYPKNEGTATADDDFSLDMRESALEQFIVQQPETILRAAKLNELFYQLPIGVFEGSISNQTHVFTGGKSAVDLWGIGEKGNAALFELKNSKNTKVGLITELLFYSFVLLDTMGQKPRFQHDCDSSVANRCSREAFDALHGARTFTAYALAPGFHPSIDSKLFDQMNQHASLPEHMPELLFDALQLSVTYRVDTL